MDVHNPESVISLEYLEYELNNDGEYNIGLNTDYTLTGKVVLPTHINSIPVA